MERNEAIERGSTLHASSQDISSSLEEYNYSQEGSLGAPSGFNDRSGSSTPEPPSEGGNDVTYLCNICGKVFTILARLQRHIRIHTGEKPFACEFCEKSFSVKENLIVHRRIHTKERPYQCNICDRAFEHSGKLHRHMRTHTGERPHRCELCGKTFVQSGQLVIHMRAHTGEKPYTCDYCQKGFTCSKQLKVHTRIHTGEKPYECDVCGKTFGYNHVLKMHKMSHLGEKLYKCTLCDKFFNSRKALDRHIKEHDEDPFSNMKKSSKGKGSLKSSPTRSMTKTPPSNLPPASSQSQSPLPPIQPQVPESFSTDARSSLEKARVPESSSMIESNYFPQYGDVPRVSLSPPTSAKDVNALRQPISSNFRHPEFLKGHKYDQMFLKNNWKDNSFLPSSAFVPGTLPNSVDSSHLTFFTTIDGERIACPSSQVIRIPGPTFNFEMDSKFLPKEYQETMKIREELKDHIQREETRKSREKQFLDCVIKVLHSCIGKERLQKLGYPKYSVDEVIMNTLKLTGTHPCWEPSLDPLDRIKVNLRLLLECCIPDPELWEKFGWKGKSIEEIVGEFLSNSV